MSEDGGSNTERRRKEPYGREHEYEARESSKRHHAAPVESSRRASTRDHGRRDRSRDRHREDPRAHRDEHRDDHREKRRRSSRGSPPDDIPLKVSYIVEDVSTDNKVSRKMSDVRMADPVAGQDVPHPKVRAAFYPFATCSCLVLQRQKRDDETLDEVEEGEI